VIARRPLRDALRGPTRYDAVMLLFAILFAINVASAMVALMFFMLGLHDGSVTSANILLWAAMLSALYSAPGAAWLLRLRGRPRAGTLLLIPVAAVATLAAAAMVVLMLNPGSWR